MSTMPKPYGSVGMNSNIGNTSLDVAPSGASMSMMNARPGGNMDKPKLGSGARFAALKNSLAKKPGIRNPSALAAKLGDKKFGVEKMERMAAAGRHRAAMGA